MISNSRRFHVLPAPDINKKTLVVRLWGVIRSDPIRSGLVRSDPIPSHPIRSGPVLSGPVRSGPIRSDPIRSGPIQILPTAAQTGIEKIFRPPNQLASLVGIVWIGYLPKHHLKRRGKIPVFCNHALDKRFGNKQVIISKHIELLMQLPIVSDGSDLKKLRQLMDRTEAAVRSLKGIGISTETYGTFLTPAIMGKIPQEFKRENVLVVWGAVMWVEIVKQGVIVVVGNITWLCAAFNTIQSIQSRPEGLETAIENKLWVQTCILLKTLITSASCYKRPELTSEVLIEETLAMWESFLIHVPKSLI